MPIIHPHPWRPRASDSAQHLLLTERRLVQMDGELERSASLQHAQLELAARIGPSSRDCSAQFVPLPILIQPQMKFQFNNWLCCQKKLVLKSVNNTDVQFDKKKERAAELRCCAHAIGAHKRMVQVFPIDCLSAPTLPLTF